MSIYFDSINWTAKISPNFDPQTDWFAFMHYKLQDWCTKIGPNYAKVLTGVPEWEAGTHTTWSNTSPIYLQLQLVPDDERAGYSADPLGIHWQSTSSDYLYFYNVAAFGDTRATDYGDLPLTSSTSFTSYNNYFSSTYYNRGYSLVVAYSDTPGREWFAWHDSRLNTWGTRGVLTRTAVAPGLSQGNGLGWAYLHGSLGHAILSRDKSGSLNHFYTSRYGGRSGEHHLGTSDSSFPTIYRNPLALSRQGFPTGRISNTAFLSQPSTHMSFLKTTDDNKDWMVWNDYIAIDVTGEF